MRVSPLAEWGGGEVQYLVLRSAERRGHLWLQVRLPERPNSAAGWIRADLTRDLDHAVADPRRNARARGSRSNAPGGW